MDILINLKEIEVVIKQNNPELAHNFLKKLYEPYRKKYYLNCAYCGKEFFTERPDIAKYCDECRLNNVAGKVFRKNNLEKVREYNRNYNREWYRKNKEKLKRKRLV